MIIHKHHYTGIERPKCEQLRTSLKKAKPVQVEEISSNPVNHSFLLQQTVAFEEQHFSSSLHGVPLEMHQPKKINKEKEK